MIGIAAFNAVYSMMTDARCTVVLKDKTAIAQAVSVGLQKARDYDDRGIAGTLIGNVRYLAIAETGRKAQIDDVITITFGQNNETLKARVASRIESAGAIRLDVEGESEQ